MVAFGSPESSAQCWASWFPPRTVSRFEGWAPDCNVARTFALARLTVDDGSSGDVSSACPSNNIAMSPAEA